VTGTGIVSDDGPAIVAAGNAASIVYIGAAGATVSSYTVLPTNRKYILGGGISVRDTIEDDGGNILEAWVGSYATAFAWEGAPQIIGSLAYPMLALNNGPHSFKRIYINCTASNGCLDIWDFGATNVSMDYGALQTGNGNPTDYLGMHAIFSSGGFSYRFDKMLFTTGSPGTNAESNVGFSPIPSVVFNNKGGQISQPSGNWAVTRS
jgi:hypothetical protein